MLKTPWAEGLWATQCNSADVPSLTLGLYLVTSRSLLQHQKFCATDQTQPISRKSLFHTSQILLNAIISPLSVIPFTRSVRNEIVNPTIKSLQSNSVLCLEKHFLCNNLGLFWGVRGVVPFGWEPKVLLKCKEKMQLKEKKYIFKAVCQNPREVKKPEKNENERNQTSKISHCGAIF